MQRNSPGAVWPARGAGKISRSVATQKFCSGNRDQFRRQAAKFTDKYVTFSRARRNVSRLRGAVFEDATQGADLYTKVPLIDVRVRPNNSLQRSFTYHRSVTLDERDQCAESTCSKANQLCITKQLSTTKRKDKRTEARPSLPRPRRQAMKGLKVIVGEGPIGRNGLQSHVS
jgi:hypothetical protein